MSPDCHSCCACRSVGRAEPWDEDTTLSRAFKKPGEPSRPHPQCSRSGAAGAAARRGAAKQMTSAGGEAWEQVGRSKRKSWREVQSSSRTSPWFPTPPTWNLILFTSWWHLLLSQHGLGNCIQSWSFTTRQFRSLTSLCARSCQGSFGCREHLLPGSCASLPQAQHEAASGAPSGLLQSTEANIYISTSFPLQLHHSNSTARISSQLRGNGTFTSLIILLLPISNHCFKGGSGGTALSLPRGSQFWMPQELASSTRPGPCCLAAKWAAHTQGWRRTGRLLGDSTALPGGLVNHLPEKKAPGDETRIT